MRKYEIMYIINPTVLEEGREELINQVNFNRTYPEVKGSIFFSYKSLLTNPKNATSSLAQGPYANRENQEF